MCGDDHAGGDDHGFIFVPLLLPYAWLCQPHAATRSVSWETPALICSEQVADAVVSTRLLDSEAGDLGQRAKLLSSSMDSTMLETRHSSWVGRIDGQRRDVFKEEPMRGQ